MRDKVGHGDEDRMDFEVVERGTKDKLGLEAEVWMVPVIKDNMVGHEEEDSKLAQGEEDKLIQVVDEAEERPLFNRVSRLLNLLKVSTALL